MRGRGASSSKEERLSFLAPALGRWHQAPLLYRVAASILVCALVLAAAAWTLTPQPGWWPREAETSVATQLAGGNSPAETPSTPPTTAPPSLPGAWPHGFPNRIFLTVRNRTLLDCTTLDNIDSWVRLNPDCDVYVFDDRDIAEFFARCRPDLQDVVKALHVPVQRADVWRYAVLQTFGGVYSDADARAVAPVRQWKGINPTDPTSSVRMVVGVERLVGEPTFQQWTFAAAAWHPVLATVLENVRSALKARNGVAPLSDTDVLRTTGPVVWSAAIRDWFKRHGALPDFQHNQQAGDVVSQNGALSHGWASDCTTLDARVHWICHQFHGTWKKVYFHRPKLTFTCPQVYAEITPVAFDCQTRS